MQDGTAIWGYEEFSPDTPRIALVEVTQALRRACRHGHSHDRCTHGVRREPGFARQIGCPGYDNQQRLLNDCYATCDLEQPTRFGRHCSEQSGQTERLSELDQFQHLQRRKQRVMTNSAIWTAWSCRVRVTVTRKDVLDDATRQLTELMADVSRAANRFDPESDLSRINAAAGQMVPVTGRTLALVDAALDAADVTGGAVDPTIGGHLLHAGYRADIDEIRDRLVPEGLVNERIDQADWTQVRVNRQLGLIGVPVTMRLDLGATAKAWTADTAAHGIAQSLGTGVLVEIGGDVAVAGTKSTPWQILVSERHGERGQDIGLTHGGLATSSTTARRWRTSRGEQHHIIDPRTGEPAQGPWRTATVWAPSAVEANTMSTAVIVLGDEAIDFLAETGSAARLIDQHGQLTVVGQWPSLREVA